MDATTKALCALVEVPPSLMRADLERRVPEVGTRFEDLSGLEFGDPAKKVIGFAGWLKQYSTWLCQCHCGNLFLNRANAIKNRPSGCGCGHQTHGLSGTYWMTIYCGMMQRCYNPKCPAYRYYGSRGIKVCKRWRTSLEAFAADMGDRPTAEHSVDRIDFDGDYSPVNCRWATPLEQARNRRGIRWLTVNGESLPMSAWAEQLGVTREAMRLRTDKCLELGADPAEAVTTPVGEMLPCVLRARDNRVTSVDEKSELPSGVYYGKTLAKFERFREFLDGNVHQLRLSVHGADVPVAFRSLCNATGYHATVRLLDDYVLVKAEKTAS